MKLYDLMAELEVNAPSSLIASWDNDGIMCAPHGNCDITKVAIALDPTKGAIEYASDNACQLLLTHHPLIFKGLKRLDGEDAVSSRVIMTLSKGITVVSLHTRLDAADNGVNDVLASLLGGEIIGSFGDADCPKLGRLVSFGDGISADELAGRVKSATGAFSVRVTGDGIVKTAAVVGGAGKSLTEDAIAAGADALVTGESGYNTAEAAAEEGLVTIEAGHFHTEAPACRALAEKLRVVGLDVLVYEKCPYRDI